MSESVASALEYLDNDATQQTRLFIRMIDKFFDCLNAKGPQMAKLKRKNDIAPYARSADERFKVKNSILTFYFILPVLYLIVLLIYSGYAMISLATSLSGKGKLLQCLVLSRVRSRSWL